MKKCILLDRDGVINQDSWQYIRTVEECIFLPGSIEAIVRLSRLGYILGIATNQSGIARGYYSEEMLQAIHQKLQDQVHQQGGRIDAIEYCPHLPEAGCRCRKPRPGMLLNLAQRLDISLENIPFVGDRVTDIQAALAVGAAPFVILSPMTDKRELRHYPKVPVFASLLSFVMYWEQQSCL